MSTARQAVRAALVWIAAIPVAALLYAGMLLNTTLGNKRTVA